MAAFEAITGCFHTRYTYWFIRPTQADNSITLATALPNHPSYPSAHSGQSGVAGNPARRLPVGAPGDHRPGPSRGRSLRDLLDTFGQLRAESLHRLATLGLTDADLTRRGSHPEFGVVTMGQHLATWVAHDLGHVGQIVRVMAGQYGEAVGPWRAYLPILGPA